MSHIFIHLTVQFTKEQIYLREKLSITIILLVIKQISMSKRVYHILLLNSN